MTHRNCKVYVSTPSSQLPLCYKRMVLLFYSSLHQNICTVIYYPIFYPTL